MNQLGAVEETQRGFEIVKFVDRSGVPCSLQASSLAEYEKPGTSAIWIGCEDANPQVFVPYGNPAWQPFPLPKDCVTNTRAHLSREQVEVLILHLQNWLEADSFEIQKDQETA